MYILTLIFICGCKLLVHLHIYYKICKAVKRFSENDYMNSNLCMCQALWILRYASPIPVLVHILYLNHPVFSNTIFQIQTDFKYPAKFFISLNYPYSHLTSPTTLPCPTNVSYIFVLGTHSYHAIRLQHVVLRWPSPTSLAFPKCCWDRKYRFVVVQKN